MGVSTMNGQVYHLKNVILVPSLICAFTVNRIPLLSSISWSIPISVLLVVPLGIIGYWLTQEWLLKETQTFQIIPSSDDCGDRSFCKKCDLEFAKELQEKGENLLDATLQKCVYAQLSWQPLPSVLATCPCNRCRCRKSTLCRLLGGVLSATFLGIFFIPVFGFVVSLSTNQKP